MVPTARFYHGGGVRLSMRTIRVLLARDGGLFGKNARIERVEAAPQGDGPMLRCVFPGEGVEMEGDYVLDGLGRTLFGRICRRVDDSPSNDRE